MKRITINTLKQNAAMLNRITNSPAEAYSKGEDGRNKANVGNYHISQAYGGFCLHRMANEGGGITDVLYCGHIPARELHNLIWAYVRGLEQVAA
jgi:hypothetical protein